MELRNVYLTVCFLLLNFSCFCQFDLLKKSIALSDSFNTALPREKVFIHYDKPYYNMGDTLWLKGYIVSAKDNAAADSSNIAYIEIIGSTGALIKRTSTYAAGGIFYAAIKLNEADFKQGSYLLRAYTRHMRNYGDSLFYKSWFTITDVNSNGLNLLLHTSKIVNKRFVLTATLASQTQADSILITLRKKNSVIFKQPVKPGNNGLILIDTILVKANKGEPLQLQVSGSDNVNIQLPVMVDEQNNIDLQFLPEGGSFIAGKWQQLGFKATDVFGKGIPVSGKIENSKKQLITTFSSIHAGMGTVWLTPQANEHYTAVLDNGFSFSLPSAVPTGTLLRISNQPASDSISITIDASPDLYNKSYYFNATAKGISCAFATLYLKDKPYSFSVSKKAFPSGICRFTLYNDDRFPVNERITFIWHHDALTLNLLPHKPVYKTRDSVHLLLSASNIYNEPSIGTFSIAVIDTGQVQYSRNRENIISYLLLSSDLKGKVEDTWYYFDSSSALAAEALMLTQGWVSYDRFISKPVFEYEKEFMIKGKVTNLLNKPVANSGIVLFGKDGMANRFFLETKTGTDGSFVITDFPVFTTDSAYMLVRALNKKGKAFGIGVEIEEPSFPLNEMEDARVIQNGILYDTAITKFIQQQSVIQAILKKDKNTLQEVILKSRKKIKGSKNLNEDGGADQVISERVLEKTPKQNLLDVLLREVPGFHKGPLPKNSLRAYKRNGDLVVFIIDGYNINQAYDPVSERSTAFTDYVESFLQYITAEEVAGVEVMNTTKNAFAYEKYYRIYSNAQMSYTFIEITTHSGNGAFNKKVPGSYLYKPVAPVISKRFYSPLYTASTDTGIPDHRTTVYWKQDIITNEKGEADISFPASDNHSGYLVIVQGTDLNGGLGVAYLSVQIEK